MTSRATWIDRFLPEVHPAILSGSALLANFLCNIVAGAAFRYSALTSIARGFLF